ncbi:hypothetical protein [Streptomyces sp. NPDC093261]|uniref:hypothetical protein n=1 Tax=Streptomyces sp. NPDC093261 TaxID=3366037 RepID=UPI003801D98B
MAQKLAASLIAGDVVTDQEMIREARRNAYTRVPGDIRVVRNVRTGRKWAHVTMGNYGVAKVAMDRMVDVAS